MTHATPEATIQSVIDACGDCDICRTLMDEGCLFFPALYRIFDKQLETRHRLDAETAMALADHCTLCGLCPCPNIRNAITRAKAQMGRTAGVPLRIRLLADVQRIARWGSKAPRLANALMALPLVARAVKKLIAVHCERSLPPLAADDFFTWAKRRGRRPTSVNARKVAYFAGCSAGYFFPNVARSTMAVLWHNGINVHVPEQQCCGMPTLVEGCEKETLERVRANTSTLAALVNRGYDVICSCPTCGFLLKVLLKEGAHFAEAFQKSVNAAEDEMLIPGPTRCASGFLRLKKSIYRNILKDDGVFAAMDPLKRISVSNATRDLGAYLLDLLDQGKLNLQFGAIDRRVIYYAPCHQREQGMGAPYLELLSHVPGLKVQSVASAVDCCGMGGSLGYKASFHTASKSIAAPLIGKIEAAGPQAIVTDCLSCRLQFMHLLPNPVFHPVELLSQAYGLAH